MAVARGVTATPFRAAGEGGDFRGWISVHSAPDCRRSGVVLTLRRGALRGRALKTRPSLGGQADPDDGALAHEERRALRGIDAAARPLLTPQCVPARGPAAVAGPSRRYRGFGGRIEIGGCCSPPLYASVMATQLDRHGIPRRPVAARGGQGHCPDDEDRLPGGLRAGASATAAAASSSGRPSRPLTVVLLPSG